jgi:hypothetical protein
MNSRGTESFPVASFLLAVTYALTTTAHLVDNDPTANCLDVGESHSSSMAPCPTECTCTTSPASRPAITSLVIACDVHTGSGNASLEFDAVFSSLHSEPLTSLQVIGSLLAVLPRSMCGLTQLQLLYLDKNSLTELPDDCLNRMTGLRQFNATNNHITTIQVLTVLNM